MLKIKRKWQLVFAMNKKSNTVSKKFINIFLRLVNTGTRFLLTIFIAKYFPIEDLGVYGLIVAGVSFAIYPLGFEFYTYSTRELLKKDKSDWGEKLSSQLLFHLLLYVVFISIYYVALHSTSVSGLVFFVLALVVLEHANQELFRLHVVDRDQLVGSLNMFLRQGIWGLIFIPWSFYMDGHKNIESLLVFWIYGEVAALAFSLYWFSVKSKIRFAFCFDWVWIKSSFHSIIPLFIATIFLRGLGTLDRFFFESLGEMAQLSAYVFYVSLASLVYTVSDSGVFSFRYPELVKSYQVSVAAYLDEIRLISKQVLFISLVASGLIFSLSGEIGRWIENEAILAYPGMLIVLLLAKNIQVFGMIFHYGMYAKKMDKQIMYINAIGFVSFVLFVVGFRDFGAVISVPAGLCVGYLMILILKAVFSLSLNNLASSNKGLG